MTPPTSPTADTPPSEGSVPLDREELARFFGYSRDLFAILDAKGHILIISPSVERMLGHPADDLAEHRLLQFVHPVDATKVRSEVRRLFSQPGVADFECRVRHAQGHWLPMSWSVSVDELSNRIYCVGRDRTGDIRRREEARTRAAAELRLRTAAELHDGVLQTLTAAGLQLAVAQRMVAQDPQRAAEVLEKIAESMAAEQRELRLYVDELKLEEPMWADAGVPLEQRIGDMLSRIHSIWGVATELNVDLGEGYDPEFDRRVLRLIQEAVVNAARHGGARRVEVSVREKGQNIEVLLQDDGHGFPFSGDYDYEALKERRLGPVSLKQRVAQGRGTLSIRSTPQGARLQIVLPLERSDS